MTTARLIVATADDMAAHRAHLADVSDRLRVGHHEAGHAVAAVLTGVEWKCSHIAPPEHPALAGATWLTTHGVYTDNATVRAFIHWAGPWAESRFTGRPLADIIASTSASADRAHFAAIRSTHPNVDRDWAALLDPCWPTVERAAVLLAAKHTPLMSTDGLPSAALVEQVLAGFR